jgi:hypothetical protein
MGPTAGVRPRSIKLLCKEAADLFSSTARLMALTSKYTFSMQIQPLPGLG